MATRKKGLFTKLIEGPERSEDYARKTLPSNRWALGWDIIKGNVGKLMKINLLILLFAFPIFLVVALRSFMLEGQSMLAPFSQNLGMGYPAYPNIQGMAESITFQSDIYMFVGLIIVSFYINIGIAGGFYVIRNLVWTEGVFVASDFWIGVKKNYKETLPHTILFIILLSFTYLSIDISNLAIALDSSKTGVLSFFKILSYVFMALIVGIYLYSLTLTVTYKNKFAHTLKNAFILMIGLLPINAFFMVFSLVPFILLLTNVSSILFSIGLILAFFLSFSITFLIWTNYSQWSFDECINDRVAGAKKNRGIYKKESDFETEKFVYKKSIITKKPVKPITDYDVEISILPESFSRADLIKLEESKKRMIEDSDKYAEEHKDDYLKEQNEVEEFMNNDKKSKK